MTTDHFNEDAVMACADLVDRTGAAGFEIGHLDDDPTNPRWYAHAQWRGTRISVDERRSPTEAANALAERLLRNATCRCGRVVALSGDRPERCRWRLMGPRWEPGCDAPPIRMGEGTRGDVGALQRAMRERVVGNRASRRRAARKGHAP